MKDTMRAMVPVPERSTSISFTTTTAIHYSLDERARVYLRVYNMLGQVVTTLIEGDWHSPGLHTTGWDGRDEDGRPVSSGTYFYTLTLDNRRVTKAMVLVR